jgi:uncharacterized membrane protein
MFFVLGVSGFLLLSVIGWLVCRSFVWLFVSVVISFEFLVGFHMYERQIYGHLEKFILKVCGSEN